jgi:hypothetical protein
MFEWMHNGGSGRRKESIEPLRVLLDTLVMINSLLRSSCIACLVVSCNELYCIDDSLYGTVHLFFYCQHPPLLLISRVCCDGRVNERKPEKERSCNMTRKRPFFTIRIL